MSHIFVSDICHNNTAFSSLGYTIAPILFCTQWKKKKSKENWHFPWVYPAVGIHLHRVNNTLVGHRVQWISQMRTIKTDNVAVQKKAKWGKIAVSFSQEILWFNLHILRVTICFKGAPVFPAPQCRPIQPHFCFLLLETGGKKRGGQPPMAAQAWVHPARSGSLLDFLLFSFPTQSSRPPSLRSHHQLFLPTYRLFKTDCSLLKFRLHAGSVLGAW